MSVTRIILDHQSTLTIGDVLACSRQQKRILLSDHTLFRETIDAGHQLVLNALNNDQHIYGLTTGFGQSISQRISPQDTLNLQANLIRYHGCGLGVYFNEQETRALMVARLCSLSKGYSGISYDLLTALTKLLEHDILPQIPQEGSVGASGDLTPLSYLAAVLTGKRKVTYQNTVYATDALLKQLAIPVYTLKPKEALALMNGTSVMTGLACLAYDRARYLIELSCRITAMSCRALKGHHHQFHPNLFAAKPHIGQVDAAQKIFQHLQENYAKTKTEGLQNPYSIRCAPHVIGSLGDALRHYREVIETELNSANDNPIVCVNSQTIYHGGHFYGGHIAMVMDGLKTLVANIADLLDRQVALLLDSRMNQDLPLNLSVGKQHYQHGFKALQITLSACTAEALKLTLPASIFSRSTECHNQDKVSMGTIAARDALRVIELTEQCTAMAFLVSAHANFIRNAQDNYPQPQQLDSFIQTYPLLKEDRELESEIRQLTQLIQEHALI